MSTGAALPPTLDGFFRQIDWPQPEHADALREVLRNIAFAARAIQRDVQRGALADIFGAVGSTNVQGEEVQKLDILSDTIMEQALLSGGAAACYASEERESLAPLTAEGPLVVLADPLDGSSNIDVNIPVGTIFSVYARLAPYQAVTEADCLQPGDRQLAAGYVLYGSSTALVLTVGRGVQVFTLDPSVGEFFLTEEQLQMPKLSCYSLNDSQKTDFQPGVQQFLQSLAERVAAGEKLSPRYVGSMVADVHRNLLKGGFFAYPGTVKKPQGKLRLLYEANPMAWILEQAGGGATNGLERILSLQPTELHQRTPVFLGPQAEIDLLKKLQAATPV